MTNTEAHDKFDRIATPHIRLQMLDMNYWIRRVDLRDVVVHPVESDYYLITQKIKKILQEPAE